MGDYGAASTLIQRLVDRAGSLTIDEAFDLYTAYATRILIHGTDAQRVAVSRAQRAAARAGLRSEYQRARQAGVTAWRRALPDVQGPWLLVGAAIANAAGALVVEDSIDDRTFQILVGPWKQTIGTMIPVGPGWASDVSRRPVKAPGQLIG